MTSDFDQIWTRSGQRSARLVSAGRLSREARFPTRCRVFPASRSARALDFTGNSHPVYGRRSDGDSASDPSRPRPARWPTADPAVQAIQITKQASGRDISCRRSESVALHANVGVQRQIARDFVLSADFVYRHFVHLPLAVALST